MPVEPHADSRVVISRDTVAEDLGVGGVVVNLHTLRPTSLDRVGMSMWKALSAAPTVEGAVTVLTKEFVVDRDVLERDLLEVIRELADIGLVTIADGLSAPEAGRAPQAEIPAVDARAVMDQRHHDGLQALIALAGDEGVPGDVVTVGPAGASGAAVAEGPISVLHLAAGCGPMSEESLGALCRRVVSGGLVIVDDYDEPSRRRVVDAVRADLASASPLEIMDWSRVWWRV